MEQKNMKYIEALDTLQHIFKQSSEKILNITQTKRKYTVEKNIKYSAEKNSKYRAEK